MRPRILIVDDEAAIARALQPVLTSQGWDVFIALRGADGLRTAQEEAVDLVLLDLGLPDADGKDLIPELRSKSGASIIVISARHQEAEKVASLDAGADDYVDKPFGIDELMARVRAAQRRAAGTTAGSVIEAGPISLETQRRKVFLEGEEIKLSPKEFELLRLLVERAGQVVTQRRLLLAGWGDPGSDPQYLRTYVALLRQKLEEDPSEPRLILTEPGVGYRLDV